MNKFLCPTGCNIRRFASTLPVRILACRDVDEVVAFIRDNDIQQVPTKDAMSLLRNIHKGRSDKRRKDKFEQIPRVLTRLITSSVVLGFDSMAPRDLITLAEKTGTSDEYLMYMIARCVEKRMTDFTPIQLADVISAFAQSDLCDESMISACLTTILPQNLPLSELTKLHYILSKISYHDSALTRFVSEGIIGARRRAQSLPVKDVVKSLIAFSHNGHVHDFPMISFLWNSISPSDVKYLSREEMYELLFPVLMFVHAAPAAQLLRPILSSLRKDKRFHPRINILLDCVEHGLVPYWVDDDIVKAVTFRKREEFSPGSPALSGLHLEVCSTLDEMGIGFKAEQQIGRFRVDLVLD